MSARPRSPAIAVSPVVPRTRREFSPAPEEQKVDDLRVMCSSELKRLSYGRTVAFQIGQTVVDGIPRRAVMALSVRMNKYFTDNPESDAFGFPPSTVNPGAVRFIFKDWLRKQCFREDYKFDVIPSQRNFYLDIHVLRAAREIGIGKVYQKDLFDLYLRYVKTTLLQYEEIFAIIKYSNGNSINPLFLAMVNHLSHVRYRNELPDPEVFAAFLSKHPFLKSAMDRVDTYWRTKNGNERI